MHRKSQRLMLVWGICVLIVCAAAAVIVAGEYHAGAQMVCSDCHVAHASEKGVAMVPTAKLLKNSGGEVPLCMNCHDGTDLRAPDITGAGTSGAPSNVVGTAYTSKYGSSAGFFQNDYLSSSNPGAHDLVDGVPATAPLSASYTNPNGLVCSDCHEPHGTPNYRNLISDPNPNHTGSFDIRLGTQIREIIPVDAISPNAAVAYNTSNVALYADNNLNNWCADCHDQLSTNTTGSSPAHFKGHPGNVDIGASGAHTDLGNWLSGTATTDTGFGADIGDLAQGIPRVRYGSPSGSNTAVGSGDRVSCLSCHKAHGSKNRHGLLWPYSEGGVDGMSGCQQCHFK